MMGSTLAAVAQQYEDAQGFGPNTMRALAAQFYTSATYKLFGRSLFAGFIALQPDHNHVS